MPKFFNISSATLPLLAAVLVLSLSAGYFTLAWSEPSGPMPASVDAPINTGSTAQVKTGDLAIGSSAVKYWLTQSGQSFALKNNAGSINLIVGQDGNVGIGTASPGAKLDVQGQIIGGFGAITTAGVLDWNDPSNIRSGSGYTLLMGNAASGPGPASYFHTLNFEYSSKNGSGNITQLAIPYASPSNAGIYIRGRYSGSWSSWSQIGGGASSQWITSGSNIYYNTGNVGIGTTAPGAKLSFGTNYDTVGNNPTYNIRLFESGTTVYGFGVQSGTLAINANQASGKIVFNAGTANDAPTTRMTILGDGNVGIGTTAPQYKLSLPMTTGTFGAYSDATHYGNITPYDSGGYMTFDHLWSSNSGGYRFRNGGSAADLVTILGTGKVGIGTTAPAAKLAVGGIGSSGDTIAAYANSANSALYAEQQNAAGYAGYFKGDVNITKNLFVGGNINATGTINSATALCVNSVCANSTVWNTIVSGSGSGGSITTNLGFNTLIEGGHQAKFPVSLLYTSIFRANLDPVSRSLIITTADYRNKDGGNDDNKKEYVLDLQKNDYGNYEIKSEGLIRTTRRDSICAKAGNFIYCGINDDNDGEYIYRGSTKMTLDEPDKVRQLLFSDGVYLYLSGIDNNAYRLYKYEISGTDLISKGYVTLPAINSYEASPLATDGSYIYAYVSSEKKIKRYNFSGGSSVKEWSVPVKDFFFIENNRFITGSAIFGYGGEYLYYSGDQFPGVSIIGLNFYDLGAVD